MAQSCHSPFLKRAVARPGATIVTRLTADRTHNYIWKVSMEYVGTDDQRRSTFYSRVIREGYCDNYDLPPLKGSRRDHHLHLPRLPGGEPLTVASIPGPLSLALR